MLLCGRIFSLQGKIFVVDAANLRRFPVETPRMPNQSPVITDKSLSSEILAQFFSIYIFTLVAHSIEPNSIRGKSRPSAIIKGSFSTKRKRSKVTLLTEKITTRYILILFCQQRLHTTIFRFFFFFFLNIIHWPIMYYSIQYTHVN